MEGLILAFQLFSRISIPIRIDFNKDNRRRALFFLPLVGAVIGLVTGLVVYLFRKQSNLLGASFGLAAYCFISGSIHLDGLADSFDGFFSNREEKRILEIMADSMMGTFGALALIVYCLLKFSLYASLEGAVIPKLLLVSMISRCSSLYIVSWGPSARPGGFGDALRESLEGQRKFIYLEIAGLALVSSLLFRQGKVLLLFAAMFLLSQLVIRFSRKKIGGLTGDVYGANAELNELLALTLAACFLN